MIGGSEDKLERAVKRLEAAGTTFCGLAIWDCARDEVDDKLVRSTFTMEHSLALAAPSSMPRYYLSRDVTCKDITPLLV